jgi:hypothetical protein
MGNGILYANCVFRIPDLCYLASLKSKTLKFYFQQKKDLNQLKKTLGPLVRNGSSAIKFVD